MQNADNPDEKFHYRDNFCFCVLAIGHFDDLIEGHCYLIALIC